MIYIYLVFVSKSHITNYSFRYLIYAQGLPVVIVIIILIVDKIGQSKYTQMKDLKHFPNMGKYGCNMGNGISGHGEPYFAHPIFIYFQSYMLV